MNTHGLVARYVAYAVMIAVVGAGLLGWLEREGHATASNRLGHADLRCPQVTRQGLKPSLRAPRRHLTKGTRREPRIFVRGREPSVTGDVPEARFEPLDSVLHVAVLRRHDPAPGERR